MSIPVDIQFKFGSELDQAEVNPDEVLTAELKDRITKLLTGKYEVDAEGRCIIMPGVPVPDNFEPCNSVCVGVDLGPVQISFCKDV